MFNVFDFNFFCFNKNCTIWRKPTFKVCDDSVIKSPRADPLSYVDLIATAELLAAALFDQQG